MKKPIMLAAALALAGIFANSSVLAQACPAGQSVDPTRGMCVNAPAGSTSSCPAGQYANGVGGCTSPATAYPPAGATGFCPAGQVANGSGGCVVSRIAAVCTCPPGLMFSAKTGSCVIPPAGATGMCPASQVADGFGACMTPRR